MNKTFFDLDYEFYQKFPEVANVCGCTALIVMLIESKAFVFSLGDCKGFLFRNDIIYQMSLDHLPVIYINYHRVEVMKDPELKMQVASFNMIG